MTTYPLSEIAKLFSAAISNDRPIDTLLTDSRTLIPHPERVLFFALKTRKGNGHLYISDLYDKGVRAFVVSEEPKANDFPEAAFIHVNDTLEALQKIAIHHRAALTYPIVAITGSAGKTTTKELLYSLLSKGTGLRVGRSPQSYNSGIGVPLSLWQLEKAADLGIIEAGISEPGEMALLHRLIRPEIGLFTGIGPAHNENFESPLEKAVEKLKLFEGCRMLYLSSDDETVMRALESSRETLSHTAIKYWSLRDPVADLYVTGLEELPGSTLIRYRLLGEDRERSVTVPFHEKGLIYDTILSLLFLHDHLPSFFDDSEKAARLFRELTSPSMRMEVIGGENDTLLVLPWGSNAPLEEESLLNALSFMRKRRLSHSVSSGKPTAVVLIDEKETDKTAGDDDVRHKRYEAIAHLIAAQRGNDSPSRHKVIAIGKGIRPFAATLSKGGEVFTFDTVSDFLSWHPTNVDGSKDNPGNNSYFDGSSALDKLSNHLILMLPPFSSSKYSLRTNNTIPPLHHLILEAFQKKSHQTILRINLSALRANLNALRELFPDGRKVKTCAMIKAFGYGVGSFEIAKEFEDEGVEYLAVAVVDEGKELRDKGIRTPIIVMNPEPSSFLQLIRYRLEPNIYSEKLLRAFGSTVAALGLGGYPIHLSFDTGMHRLGFSEHEVEGLLFYLNQKIDSAPALRVASIFTHLSKADMPAEDAHTLRQLQTIERIRDKIASHLPYSFLTHALNTAGLMRFPEYAFDMVRMGVGLYGLSPLDRGGSGLLRTPLRPVATLETVILQTRSLPAGSTVGYGNSGLLLRDSRIGVIPIGYADGLPRSLGRGRISFMAEGGVSVPTIGNICMDATLLDLTDAPIATEGSKIVLFSEEPETAIERLAGAENPPEGTIHYEVLARLSKRITRSYYHE